MTTESVPFMDLGAMADEVWPDIEGDAARPAATSREGAEELSRKLQKELRLTGHLREGSNRDVVILWGEGKAGVRPVLGRREGVTLTHVKGWSHGGFSLQGREIDSLVSDKRGTAASPSCINQEVM
jgi:hypothetical protein